jgi:hypothetical protein
MLQKIKTALQSPYAAPVTLPVEWIGKCIAVPCRPSMAIFKEVVNRIFKDILKIQEPFAPVHSSDISEKQANWLFGAPVLVGAVIGLGGAAYAVYSGAILAESAIATKIIAGGMIAIAAGSLGAVAGPIVLAAGIALVCGTFGICTSPLASLLGAAKAVAHRFGKITIPVSIPPSPPAFYNFTPEEKPVMDRILDLSTDERQQLLEQIKQKCGSDFDAVAYPKGSAVLQEDLVIKPSPFAKKQGV